MTRGGRILRTTRLLPSEAILAEQTDAEVAHARATLEAMGNAGVSDASDPVGAASGDAAARHLALMHAQRDAMFEALAGVPESRLWVRPAPKKWSPGEHVDHTRVLDRTFRRLLTVAWPVVSPWPALLPAARKRLERPYPTDIDDVYQRPSMPSWVGFLFPPRRAPSRPASLAELERALADEHDAVARFTPTSRNRCSATSPSGTRRSVA